MGCLDTMPIANPVADDDHRDVDHDIDRDVEPVCTTSKMLPIAPTSPKRPRRVRRHHCRQDEQDTADVRDRSRRARFQGVVDRIRYGCDLAIVIDGLGDPWRRAVWTDESDGAVRQRLRYPTPVGPETSCHVLVTQGRVDAVVFVVDSGFDRPPEVLDVAQFRARYPVRSSGDDVVTHVPTSSRVPSLVAPIRRNDHDG